MDTSLWIWIGFNVGVLALLVLDLGVFQRKAHTVGLKEALVWTGVWISLALVFNIGLYFWKGGETALQFLTGYLIEKSLSVDNIFVFALIFGYFKVPSQYQHKVLFWGILSALVMRGVMIDVGAALIERFHWIIYVFGGFLVITGIKMIFQDSHGPDPSKNPLLRLAQRCIPFTEGYREDRFVVRENGRWLATPLVLVLMAIEVSDLIFAVDSIPAIFAVTPDPFIVYTSNIFAILGLRSLYFALAGILDRFYYLKWGLAAVLVFVGTKMVIMDIYKIPIGLALGVVAGILATSMVASFIRAKKLALVPPATVT